MKKTFRRRKIKKEGEGNRHRGEGVQKKDRVDLVGSDHHEKRGGEQRKKRM